MSQNFDLESFGISGGISETIVTSGSGKANAAPIGIILKADKPFVRVYRGSTTYSNILDEEYFIANITYDPLLFVRSTFGDLNADEFVMESINGKRCPALKGA